MDENIPVVLPHMAQVVEEQSCHICMLVHQTLHLNTGYSVQDDTNIGICVHHIVVFSHK